MVFAMVLVSSACRGGDGLLGDLQPDDTTIVGRGDVLQGNVGEPETATVYGTGRSFAEVLEIYKRQLAERGFELSSHVEGLFTRKNECLTLMPWKPRGNPALDEEETSRASSFSTLFWVFHKPNCDGD